MVIFLLQIPYVRRIYLQMYGSGQPYLYVPLFLSYHLLTSYHNVPVAHCIPTHNRSAVCYICTQELAQISVRLVCWSKSGTSYSRNALDHFISRTLSLAHTNTYKSIHARASTDQFKACVLVQEWDKLLEKCTGSLYFSHTVSCSH
jgi:hypothetical protein